MKAVNTASDGKRPSKPEVAIEPSCRDAVAINPSMPVRARLDIRARSVVVTTRLGPAIVLQRLSFDVFSGVAAQLVSDGAEAKVKLILRHKDPLYCVTLEDAAALDDAVAIWRQWADRLSVAMLLTEDGGQESVVRSMLGPVQLGRTQPRRARSSFSRRPRFSKRRGRR